MPTTPRAADLKLTGLMSTLRCSQLFTGVPADDLAAIAGFAQPLSLAKGAYLFREGEPSRGFYVVQAGAINVHRVNAAGKEQVIHIFRAGESFAEAALASPTGYPAEARAVEPSTVLLLPKQPVLALIGRRPDLALRMLGHGRRVGVVQFIKGAWSTGERTALERFDDLVSWHTMGEGFTWETQDLARDVAAAGRAWEKAKELMADPSISLLVLDELNIALRYDYLPLADVVAALKARRGDLHVVVTGRNAKPELVEAADLVTEMGATKHHFSAGVKAQQGIEF